MNISSPLVERVYAMLADHGRVPFGGNYPPLRWRIGRATYDELVRAVAGEGASATLREMAARDPQFEPLVRREDDRRDERIAAGAAAWGKDGSSLFGYPVVCDETFDGIALEEA